MVHPQQKQLRTKEVLVQEAMKARWLKLWTRLEAQGDGEKVFFELSKRYRETHRFYHTLNHISWGLDELEEVRHLAKDADAVEFAFWYHDETYDTNRKDNEVQSAFNAMKVAREAGLQESFVSEVRDLILATQHSNIPDSWDTNAILIVDIDLAGLGFSWEAFERNYHNIRKEYSQYSDEEFRGGNSRLMMSLLERPNIYGSDYFRVKYEDKARVNIELLLKLQKVGRL